MYYGIVKSIFLKIVLPLSFTGIRILPPQDMLKNQADWNRIRNRAYTPLDMRVSAKLLLSLPLHSAQYIAPPGLDISGRSIKRWPNASNQDSDLVNFVVASVRSSVIPTPKLYLYTSLFIQYATYKAKRIH